MWSALGSVLVTAVAIGVSPVAIGMTLVLLMSPRGTVKAAVFGVGWITVVIAAASVAYITATAADVDTDEAADTTVNLVQIALGVFFGWLAVHTWRRRPQPGVVPAEPKVFARVDKWSVPGAAAGGVVAAVGNVKTIPLAFSGGLHLAQNPVDGAAAAAAVAVFAIVATAGVLVPLAMALSVGPDRRAAVLSASRTWIVANMSTIIIVVSTLLAAALIGKGLSS